MLLIVVGSVTGHCKTAMQCYNVLKMLFIVSSLPAINENDYATATIHYRVLSRLQVLSMLHMFLAIYMKQM